MLFALFKEKKLHKVIEHKGGRAGSPIVMPKITWNLRLNLGTCYELGTENYISKTFPV